MQTVRRSAAQVGATPCEQPARSPTGMLIPRPHQREATSAILAARATGRPGFLLGDMTGLGKTLAVRYAIAAMPEREVLIVRPKGAIPQWRHDRARRLPGESGG